MQSTDKILSHVTFEYLKGLCVLNEQYKYCILLRDNQSKWVWRREFARITLTALGIAGWNRFSSPPMPYLWSAIIALSQFTDSLGQLLPNARSRKSAAELASKLDGFFIDEKAKFQGFNFWKAPAEDVILLDRNLRKGQKEIEDKHFPEGIPEKPRLRKRAQVEYKSLEDIYDYYFGRDADALREKLRRKDWTTQSERGRTLQMLGERESGTAHLKEAVEDFRASARAVSKDREPLDWVKRQNDLGVALTRLGERESATPWLKEAAEILRTAAGEVSRDWAPLDWARTQKNLGDALRLLGELESGTDHLEEAIAAYRTALTKLTSDDVALDWATAQNDLGLALAMLGERKQDTERLEEAVAAYSAALTKRTRERVPYHWATTQNNLGNALGVRGELEGGTERLKEAVFAYRAALEEYTADEVAPQRAKIQTNLDIALAMLGKRKIERHGN
jgi:tetratricopeptide (TPR) repeat protein